MKSSERMIEVNGVEQFDRAVDGIRVVNAGSVGAPYEAEPGAY